MDRTMREGRLQPCVTALPGAIAATIAALGVTLTMVLPAHASADIDCEPAVRLKQTAFTRCVSMMALGPANDTRANLLLLLLDRDAPPPTFLPPRPQPAKPLAADTLPLLFWKDIRDLYFDQPESGGSYAVGEGSRCRSNESGAAAFATAVAAADIPPDERSALVDARKALAPKCTDTGKTAADDPAPAGMTLPAVRSPTGQAFATYLQGTQAFYEGRYAAASEALSKLHGNSNAWLGNTADYMVARTDVNRLQIGAFDEYGDFVGSAHVDQAVATRAAASLEAYLRASPNGSYAPSARGLLRRVYWLSGRTEPLAATYVALIAKAPQERGIDDATLAEEIDSKLLDNLKPNMTRDPMLLATLDLQAMREPTSKPPSAPAEKPRLDLEAQRAAFASVPLLFDYLLAAQAFYVDHDPDRVLKLLPDDTRRRGGDHLWFSRQILRGLALEAKGDRNARGFWKELYPGAPRPLDQLTVQLALALHDERAKALDDVFAPGSIVTSLALRGILLQNSADAGLLRRVAKDSAAPGSERQTALYTLLYKELTRGRYANFVDDISLLASGPPEPNAALKRFIEPAPGELGCPLVKATAARLADDPRDVRARLCFAEFVRVKGMDGEALDNPPPADDLGGAPSMFTGTPYARADTYMAIIADRKADSADRAYALYRAITCYAPANNNGCGGKGVPKAQRKAWYVALKRDYPKSKWAKELTYWW